MVSLASAFSPSAAWVDRYLAVLGVERATPSIEALAGLIRTHKHTLAFENITAILRRHQAGGLPVPPVDPEALLTNWEAGRGGGVCFELAEMFYYLLTALGYAARRLLGQSREMGDHQAVLVKLGGQSYLADVGSALPVVEPIPLTGVAEPRHLGIQMRVRPGDSASRWIEERETAEGWVRYFTYDLDETADGVREAAYQRHHTPGYSFVLGNVVVLRWSEDAIVSFRGGTLARTAATGSTSTALPDPAEAERLLREAVGLPALPVAAALAALVDFSPPA